AIHELIIQFHPDFDHAPATGATQHDIVERKSGIHDLAIAYDPPLEQYAFLSLEMALQDAGDRVQGIMQRDVSDEAQPTMVDAHHGYIVHRQLACCTQHGAVAAHDDGEICLRSDAGVIRYHEFIDARIGGGFCLDQHRAPGCSHGRGQLAQWRVEAAVLVATDEGDGLEVHNELKPDWVELISFDEIIELIIGL